jgi:hypothetical protein
VTTSRRAAPAAPEARAEWMRGSISVPTPIIAMHAINGLMIRLVQRLDVRSAPTSPSPVAAIAAAGGPYRSSRRKMKISPAAKEFVERGIRTGNAAASIARTTPHPIRHCWGAGSIETEWLAQARTVVPSTTITHQ